MSFPGAPAVSGSPLRSSPRSRRANGLRFLIDVEGDVFHWTVRALDSKEGFKEGLRIIDAWGIDRP